MTEPKWRALGDDETIPAGSRWRVVFEPSNSQRAIYDKDCADTGEELCAQLEIEYQICSPHNGRFVGYANRVEVCEECADE